MNIRKFSGKGLLYILVIFFPCFLFGQEIRGLKIFVDVSAVTYIKFQKPIDGIEGSFRDKGYNFKNRSGGNALTIAPPTDRPLEPAEIEVSEGGRNHLFIITPYPKKYDTNIDPPFDYIIDNSEKLKKYIQQAEQDRANPSANATKTNSATEVVENLPAKTNVAPANNLPAALPPDKKASDDGYNANIAAGDKAFKEGNYYQAKIAYAEAYRIRVSEKYPLSRLQLIAKIEEDAAAKIKLEEEKLTAVDAGYTSDLQKADRYLQNGEYSLARETYKKASMAKPQEAYPKTKIVEIDTLVKDLLAKQTADKLQKAEEAKKLALAQEVTNKYNLAISRGDKAFIAKQFDVARLAYSDALKIKPGEKYPDDKLAEIAQTLNATEVAAAEKMISDREKELAGKYNALIAKGDKAVKDKQFELAKSAYNEAILLKPSENIAQTKLASLENDIKTSKSAEAERILAAKEKETTEKYNAVVAKADKALAARNYEVAKTEYTNAQTIKPGESYPQSQLNIIDAKTAEIAEALAKQKEAGENFKRSVDVADKAFALKEYDSAKAFYQNALQFKADDTYSKGKIAAIEKIQEDLAIKAGQAAVKDLNDRYDAATADGDKSYYKGDFEIAMVAYEKALDLIPNKTYPASQIRLIKRKQYEQAELEKTEKYNGFVSLGDKAFAAKSYESAKKYFSDALEIRPDETYPKKQIAIINDPAEMERLGKVDELKQYNAFVDEGNRAFKAGSFEEARSNFKKALNIKPDVPFVIYKLNQIDEALAALTLAEKARQQQEAQKAVDDKFNALVGKAENASNDGDYSTSINLYKQALEVKPGEGSIAGKIAAVEKKAAMVAEQAANAKLAKEKEDAINEQFGKLIIKADLAYKNKLYAEAKSTFQEAILLKPDDRYTKEKLVQIDKEIASAKNDALAVKQDETVPAVEKKASTSNGSTDVSKTETVATDVKVKTSTTEKLTNQLAYQTQPLPYSQADLFRRYNTINFYDPPPGQKLIVDAFFEADTMANYNMSQAVIAEAPRLDISDSANNVKLTLQGLSFDGSNVFLKLLIQNFGKREFLTGKLLFTWYRKDGTKSNYYACYITSYPFLLPGKQISVVYATRACSASEGEAFSFVMDDRLKTTHLELNIPAEVYIKEYER